MRIAVASAIFLLASAAQGRSIGAFELPWMNHQLPGTAYDSSDHPEAVYVFHVYANFCGWCHTLEAEVKAVAATYAGDDQVQVIDLGIDQADLEYQRWIATENPTHPVLKDVGRGLTRQLTDYLQGVSTTFVVDCRGLVVEELYGGVTDWTESVTAAVEAALASCR